MKTKVKKAQEKLFAKASARVEKLTKKKEVKKAPSTLFGVQIRHNPKAHELSIALAMGGVHTDIPTSDLILRILKGMEEMGGKFDIDTACNIKIQVLDEYDALAQQFAEQNPNKDK